MCERADPYLHMDWSEMTIDALGREFDGTQPSEAVVARHVNRTIEDLEGQFLFLEDRADDCCSAEVVAGTSIDPNQLTDEAGNPFAGIDSTGVWLVALFCTNSRKIRAPWSIALLTPC